MHKKENHFLLLIPVNIGLNVIAIKHGADQLHLNETKGKKKKKKNIIYAKNNSVATR